MGTLGLTLFTMQSKIQPSTVAILIFVVFFAMLVTLLVWLVMVFGFGRTCGGLSLFLSYIGAVLACLIIVFDTARIMSTTEFDDYLICAVELYMDIIYLFLKILELMGGKK